MANIRKPRVPKEEQLKLINECRSSGMTDIDWCREHGIAVSTFYYFHRQLLQREFHEAFKREPMQAGGGALIERLDNIILECVLLKKELSKAK